MKGPREPTAAGDARRAGVRAAHAADRLARGGRGQQVEVNRQERAAATAAAALERPPAAADTVAARTRASLAATTAGGTPVVPAPPARVVGEQREEEEERPFTSALRRGAVVFWKAAACSDGDAVVRFDMVGPLPGNAKEATLEENERRQHRRELRAQHSVRTAHSVGASILEVLDAVVLGATGVHLPDWWRVSADGVAAELAEVRSLIDSLVKGWRPFMSVWSLLGDRDLAAAMARQPHMETQVLHSLGGLRA
jgi:hypothetical protein